MRKFFRYVLLLITGMGLFVASTACSKQASARVKNPTNRVAVSQIVIAYKGAAGASRSTALTKEEAGKKARKIYTELTAKKATFEDAVKAYSTNEKSKLHGGYLGVVRQGYSNPRVEEAVFALQPGHITQPIDLPDGYHIFRVEPMEYRGYLHILLSYKGSRKEPLGVTRTKEEAKARAEELRRGIVKGDAMDPLARKFSDGMEKKRGGYLPVFSRYQLIPELQPAWDLKVDEVSDVLESPYGFHLLKRIKPLPEVIGLKAILISYAGAIMSPISVTRSHDEARDLARSIYDRLSKHEVFEDLAKKYSDDRSTRKKGGDLGLITWDEMPLEVEDVAFRLKPGMVSRVIESPGGFHIIMRTK